MRCILLTISLAMLIGQEVYAQTGSLDPAFGNGGKAITSFSSSASTEDQAQAVVVQPDGKIVVAGYFNAGSSNSEDYDIVVARFTATGALDNTFDGDGKAFVSFGTSDDRAYALTLDSNGKIIVAGSADYNNIALMRFNPDGSLDNTFDGDGKVTMPDGIARAVIIQRDGKIVVAGTIYDVNVNGIQVNFDFMLARFNPDGTPDTDFRGDDNSMTGKIRTDFGGYEEAYAMAFRPGPSPGVPGYLIVVGRTDSGLAIARYGTLFGTLSPVLDGDGKLAGSYLNASEAYGVVLQPDEKIVVVGSDNAGSTNGFAVMRYNPNGTPDNTFDGDGKVTTSFSPADAVSRAVALQSDGKIVVGGYASRVVFPNYQEFFAMARYNTNGSPDNTFSGDGKTTTAFGSAEAAITAIALQSNGAIVAVGSANGNNGENTALARYTATGSLDNTFDGDGRVEADLGLPLVIDNEDEGYALAIQADGKLVVAGYTAQYSSFNANDFALVRYNTDGSLDNTFGTGGRVITDFSSFSDEARAIAIQADGKIVVVGYTTRNDNGDEDFALVRYNTDGSLDNTFGTGGRVITDFGEDVEEARAVVIQPDGKIVVAGFQSRYLAYQEYEVTLARYNPNGSLDNTFSGDGKLITDTDLSQSEAYGLALQPDGKIIVAGRDSRAVAVFRFLPNGTPDNTFGDAGEVTTEFDQLNAVAHAVTLQPDKKIVITGMAGRLMNNAYVESDIILVRYKEDGTLDPTFGANGQVLTELPNRQAAYALALQTDGKIIVAGALNSDGPFLENNGLLRYTANGVLDPSFDGDGIVTTGEGYGFNGLKLAGNRIYAVGAIGKYVEYSRDDIVLAAFQNDVIVCPCPAPDLTPILYALSAPVYGTSDFSIVVDVIEINSVTTSGLITVKVTKDPKLTLTLNRGLTALAGHSVQNSSWTLATSEANFYVLTTTQPIAAGDHLSFGLSGVLNSGGTTGMLTSSATLTGGSGGDVRIDNNSDADKVEYFQ